MVRGAGRDRAYGHELIEVEGARPRSRNWPRSRSQAGHSARNVPHEGITVISPSAARRRRTLDTVAPDVP